MSWLGQGNRVTLKAKCLLVNYLRIYRTFLYSSEGKENKAKPSSKYYMPYLYYMYF
jgi:hypothetical protein